MILGFAQTRVQPFLWNAEPAGPLGATHGELRHATCHRVLVPMDTIAMFTGGESEPIAWPISHLAGVPADSVANARLVLVTGLLAFGATSEC